MGSTSAQVMPASTDASAAFVACGSDFCRLSYAVDELRVLKIDSIWFSDRLDPGYLQSSVAAICQVPLLQNSNAIERNLGGFLFAVSGDRLLFTQLEADKAGSDTDYWLQTQFDPKAVPRKLLTHAKPTNAVYMKSLRKIVVSTMEAKEEHPPPNGCRVMHSAISLIHASDETLLQDLEVKEELSQHLAHRLIVAQYILEHAERVYSVVEWPYEDSNGKRYCMIIIGTGITTGPGKERGRRLIFNAGKSGTRLDLQKESKYDQAVYCIAMFGTHATLSAVGKTLCFDEFEAGRYVFTLWPQD